MCRHRALWITVVTMAGAMAMSVPVVTRTETDQVANAATGIIAGRVVDAVTGDPVAGATVTLGWVAAAAASSAPVARPPLLPGSPRPGEQVTDETGRFEYTGLTAGRFTLRARGGPGYRWTTWGMQTPWDFATDRTHHELRSNERLTDIVMKLPPSGSISGTVRDERGEPIVKANVQLFERQVGPTETGWSRVPVSTTTDDRGFYRLGDRSSTSTTLPGPGPGDYVVIITAPRPAPGTAPTFAGAVYSGGARSAADAQVISLGIREHRTGVDIVVPTRPGPDWVPVRGRILNSEVLRAPLQMRLVPFDASGELANFLEISATAGVDGQFTFAAVPPGDYRLRAWQFPQGVSSGSPPLRVPAEPTWLVDRPLHVDGAGQQPEAITLRAAARITGRVTFNETSRPPAMGELFVSPLEGHPDLTVGLVRTEPDTDGRFATPGLLPGPYIVFANTKLRHPAHPEELLWSTSSILVDGREADRGLIELGAKDIDVAITLSDRRAVATGTVRDSRSQVRPDARVIMLGRDPASMERCKLMIAPSRLGVFEYSGPSRDCLLTAVTNPPKAWDSPAYLTTLTPFAVPARVELGQTRTIDLIVRP